MIADLDETIKRLLIRELDIENGAIAIEFDQPAREWSARLQKPTANLFLFDIRENNMLRQHQWQEVMNERLNGGEKNARKRTPFRVDCTYVLTAWAPEPEDEHRLLTGCLLALFRHPILTEELLVGEMRGQPFEVQTRLAAHDKLTNPTELWSALDNELRPSISYIVTIALDPWDAELTEKIIRSVTLRTGPMVQPGKPFSPGHVATNANLIGGQIQKGEAPQAGIQVAIKGTGYFSTTDEKGRFKLGGLVPGSYTLVVWPEKGKPVEREISVPQGEYDIDL